MKDELKRFKEQLKTRERISLPELQMRFDLTYRQGKAVLSALADRKLIASQTEDGLYYPVNTAYIAGRELEREEYERLACNLDEDELNLFSIIARKNTRGEGFVPENVEEELMVKVFVSQSLVHLFEGEYFVSLNAHGQRRIHDLIAEKTESICIRYIARPILCGIIEKGKMDEVDKGLLTLPFMPEECRTYIERGMERYEMEGWRPSRACTDQPPRENVLKFELIESLISACDYATKEEYDRRARTCAFLIDRSSVCGKWYKEAAKDAAAEINTELTLGNLKEIRRIILSTPNFDEDDED